MLKHTIKADGAPFDYKGQPLNEGKSTAGDGRALCSCGWVSDELSTRAGRKIAHATHKDEVEQAAAEAAAQDQADWDAADPSATPPEPAAGPTSVEDLLGLDDEPEDSTPTRVDYTAGRFWDTLGTGSVAVVTALGGAAQAHKDSRRETYLLVSGPEAVQERASTLLPQLWADARDAVNAARKDAGPMDADAAWSFGREFMVEFVSGAVSVLDGKRSARNPSKGYLAGRLSAQGV